MIKKNKKKIYTIICFFVFLFFCFFYLPINKASAAPEVKYPPLTVQGATESIGAGTTFPAYVKYLFDFGTFLGFFSVFLSLAIAGVMYFLSPLNAEFLSGARDRISGAISGLLILTLTYLIVTTINPQLKFLNSNQLSTIPPSPASSIPPGVYFYQGASCPATEKSQPNVLSIPDFGPLENKINGVDIVQGSDSYVSILYEKPNFWGKCQYIDPTQTGCQQVDNFAVSASVYKYNPNPGGDGVYFFRKSCSNSYCKDDTDCSSGESCNTTTGKCSGTGGADNTGDLVTYCKKNSGGWYEVTNDQIANNGSENLFVLDLNSVTFSDVPKDEKICTKYYPNGTCNDKDQSNPGSTVNRQAPTLGGENISSMIIKGDYVVLLVYFDSTEGGDEAKGPWTACQEFPTTNDINKIGLQQIKWEQIRNEFGVIPNYIVIFPIKK